MKKIIIIFAIFLFSCEYFSTREPEEPETSRSNFILPDTPDIVISNLISSFSNQNIINFLRCFQDVNFEGDLKFTPSQSVQAINPGFFNSWNLLNEQIVMNNVFNSLEPNAVPFLSITNIERQLNPLTAQIQADYYININHTKDDSEEYSGTLLFKMVSQSNDYWYIDEWIDFNSTSSTITDSWSNLKFNFGR